MNPVYGTTAVMREDQPVLTNLFTLLLFPVCFAVARAAVTMQTWCILPPDKRFPLGSVWEAARYAEGIPAYAEGYFTTSTWTLTIATWLFASRCFGGYYVSLRSVVFVVQKFLLWWGVGLGIGALAGLGAYTGQLERFLDSYLPFIWQAKPILEPGDTYQTFLPTRPDDAFRELTIICWEVGLLATVVWFVLRTIFYKVKAELQDDDEPLFKHVFGGEGIRFDN